MQRLPRLASGVAGGALIIAAVTVVARVAGFGRVVVFSRTVGATCVGTAYETANRVPNIVFEMVVGGALAGAVVPLVAGPIAGARRDEAARIASALLTWSLAILVPITLIGMLVAAPLAAALLGDPAGCESGAIVDMATRMLLIFLPQIPLYGVAVVLSGVLQADRRFLGPALAPLLSSLVVAGTYLVFGAITDDTRLDEVARSSELVLAGGTTLGVVVLAGSMVVPLRRAGLTLRPTLRFTGDTAGRARSLALAGLATVVAQQVATVAIVILANRWGSPASVVVYGYAWALFLLPYAVLAIPIATSAFPALAARHDAGDVPGFAREAAVTSRAVILASCFGAAVLVAVAMPAARVFLAGAPAAAGADDPALLARAVVAWAPGLVGYGLVAHLGRVLYASGRGRDAAAAIVAGWVAVIAADVVLVGVLPARDAVLALGIGNTVGMTLSGLLLITATRAVAGPTAVHGVVRAIAAGFAAAAVAGAAGWWVAGRWQAEPLASVGVAVATAALTLALYAPIVLAVAGADVRTALTRRMSRG